MAQPESGGDSLLPGESTSITSGDRDDAEHWVAVYEELSTFKDRLLQDVHEQRGKALDEGRSELDNDERMLQQEADRLRRRLEYWKRELTQR